MISVNQLTAELKEIMATITGIGFADVVTLDNDLQSTVYHNGSRIGYVGFDDTKQMYFYEVYNELLDAYLPIYHKRLTECVYWMLTVQGIVK